MGSTGEDGLRLQDMRVTYDKSVAKMEELEQLLRDRVRTPEAKHYRHTASGKASIVDSEPQQPASQHLTRTAAPLGQASLRRMSSINCSRKTMEASTSTYSLLSISAGHLYAARHAHCLCIRVLPNYQVHASNAA